MNERIGLQRLERVLGLTILLVAAYGCGGGGCGGCGGEPGTGPPYEFPATAPKLDQGGQIHVTQRGFDFITSNIEPLAGMALGGESLGFCLEPTSVDVPLLGAITICGSDTVCDDGRVGCQLDLAVESGNVTPIAPNRLEMALVLSDLNEVLPTSTFCDIELSADRIPVGINVYFEVDPVTDRVHIRVPADEFSLELPGGAIGFTGGFGCGALSALVGLFQDLLLGFVTDPLADAIDGALCVPCDEGCPAGSSCGSGDVCRVDGGDACVPIDLGAEGQFDLGELLAGFAPGLDAQLGYSAYVANYAEAVETAPGRGLDLGMQIGFHSEPNACVPARPMPELPDAYPRSPELETDRSPLGHEFMVGLGVARDALNLALWSVYNAGTLCLSIGSDSVEQISTGTFGAFLPSLGDLTGGENRPMFIDIRPEDVPYVELGSGRIARSEDGTARMIEPLIILNAENLNLDFYTLVENRPTRIFRLNLDLVIELGLDVTPENQLMILLGDLSGAMRNVEARDAELLAPADVDSLVSLLPTLVGSLLPTLTDSLADPIDLPEFAGFRLAFNEDSFTSIDGNEMLAIFADLELAPPSEGGEGGLEMPLHPEITAVHIESIDRAELRSMLDLARRGERPLVLESILPDVTIDLETLVPGIGDDAVEYSYRIGGGLWSLWHAGSSLRLRDPVLALDGNHEVEVRVRRAGEVGRASPITAKTTVRIDHTPPAVELSRDGLVGLVDTKDTIAPLRDLSIRYRVNDQGWTTLAPGETTIDLAAYEGGNAHVDVEVSDPDGNVGMARQTFNLSSRDRASDDAEVASCAVAPSGTPGAGWLLLIGLVLPVLRRRRRTAQRVTNAAATLAVALLLAACGSSSGTSGQTALCDPACEEGFVCEAGSCVAEGGDGCESDEDCAEGERCLEETCVAANTCEGDADCPDGQICIDGFCEASMCAEDADCTIDCEGDEVARCFEGRCSCEVPCEEGCAEGTYCCNATDECLDLPDVCADLTCPPGERPELQSEPTGDSTTCSLSDDGSCECVTLPPLPIGFVGKYADIAVSADGSTSAIAAFNATYGDLTVGIIGEDDEIEWMFVDGVPEDGEITGAINGPRGGIASGGALAGEHSSIAIGDDGTLHVAYSNRTERALKYAVGTEASGGYDWTLHTIDDTAGGAMFTDILTLPEGGVAIAYMAPRTILEGSPASELRVAISAAAPTSGEDFTLTTLDAQAVAIPCAGRCPGSSQCRTDTNQCQRSARDSQCEEDCGDGACFENADETFSCAAVGELPGLVDLVPGTGLFADAELVADGEMGVAYYNHTTGNLKMARFAVADPTAPTITVLDGEMVDGEGATVDTGDVGTFPDLFVAADGTISVTYVDETLSDLLHIDVASGEITVVDDGVRVIDEALFINRIGFDSAMLGTESGAVLVYQDATFHDLLQIERGEGGAWGIPEALRGAEDSYEGSFGFYLGQAVDANGRFVATYYLNHRVSPEERSIEIIRP